MRTCVRAVGTLRKRGIQLDVRVTWEDGDAERYVSEAVADGVHTVVAAGGDGTLSEVAAALAHHERDAATLPSLGLVPLGTANDFATAANVPITPLDALTLIAERVAQPVDLLRIDAEHGPRWCANVASGGFGTQVTVETDEGLKKMLGGLAYLITGMSRLGRIDPIGARFNGPDFSWEGEFIAPAGERPPGRRRPGAVPGSSDRRRPAGCHHRPRPRRRGGRHARHPGHRRQTGRARTRGRARPRAVAGDRLQPTADPEPGRRTGNLAALPHRMRPGTAADAFAERLSAAR